MEVSIIGGGLAGLCAAWELSSNPELAITVFEAGSRPGGKIQASAFAGTIVDEGADAFLRRVPEALQLCAELGIDELVSPATSSAMVWVQGELHPLPAGLVLGVPVQFEALAESGILSPEGLARARREPDIEGEPLQGDCSIGELIDRRYGHEVTERLVGPLLGGINAGAIEEMSLDAIAPQLASAAHRSRSLASALAAQADSAAGAAGAAGEAGAVFAAPVGGMSVFIYRLVDALAERGVVLRTGVTVDSVDPERPTVIAAPASVASRLLAPIAPRAAELLGEIRFASVVFTTLAFDPAELPESIRTMNASGFLAPRTSGLSMTAATFLSRKWRHLDRDLVLLRVSLGHSADAGPIAMSDEEVLDRIRDDLRATLGITAAPVEVRITRYPDAFPQYAVGHLDRTDEIERDLLEHAPRLAVCGMAHRGVGIPAAIREARLAARSLALRLGQTRVP